MHYVINWLYFLSLITEWRVSDDSGIDNYIWNFINSLELDRDQTQTAFHACRTEYDQKTEIQLTEIMNTNFVL